MREPEGRPPAARVPVLEQGDASCASDGARIEACYSRLYRGLVGAGLRANGGRQQEAEETAHDALVTTWLGQHRGAAVVRNLDAFVYGVQRVLARRRWRRSAAGPVEGDIPCTAPDVHDALSMGELLDALDGCVSSLPDRLRTLVDGLLERRSGQAMASELAVSGATITRRLDKARRALEHCLRGRGFDDSALVLVDELGAGGAS